jgi:hypothetical protein
MGILRRHKGLGVCTSRAFDARSDCGLAVGFSWRGRSARFAGKGGARSGDDGIFLPRASGALVPADGKNRPINADSGRNRAKCGSSKFAFEIKSEIF